MRLPFWLAATVSLLPLACSSTDAAKIPTDGPAAAAKADGGAGSGAVSGTTTPSALLLDLGAVQAGTDVSFDIPEGALGFNITVEGRDADFEEGAPHGVERIVAPDGTVVHDGFTPTGGDQKTSTAAFDTIASVSVPMGQSVPERLAGKWTLRVGQLTRPSSAITTHVIVRIQSSGDGTFHGGKLDLHVHVPDGLEVGGETIADGTTAADSPALQDRVDTYFKVLSRLVGIDRGEVVFHAQPATLARLDGLQAIVSGFRVSKGTKDGTQSLHILLTNAIADAGEEFAQGISPGVPGAAEVYGRNVSGVIVATTKSADQDVVTMLHESGHFFGLNHTTELDGKASDPLSDTPRCATITDKHLDTCPDRTNVMFVAGPIAGPVTLTAAQTRVYRGSPIYQAFPKGTQATQALTIGDVPTLSRLFRDSKRPLSPVEAVLSAGSCGLVRVDATALARRFGAAEAKAQLEAAATDADLAPYIRGRARLALKQLPSD